jgi:hypothetical protein
MYWTDSGPGRIQRANLDGTNVETLVTGLTAGLRGIAVDGASGKMYWADFTAGKIQRANLDGTGIQDIITGSVTGVREIALDLTAGKIYWGDYNANNIRRANLDGTNIETLWTGADTNNPGGIALDTSAGKVYWSDAGTDQVLRANLDGSNVELLIDMRLLYPDSTIASLAIDSAGGKLYFSDIAARALYRADLDGSNLVAVASEGFSFGQGIAILGPAVTVKPTTGLLTSESGSTASIQVSLTTRPAANVTIPISSSDTTEGSVAVSSLVFTPTSWNVPQTITVTGVDDAISDGTVAFTVLLSAANSADPNYSGVDPRDVSVTNTDNEVKFYVVNDASTNVSYRYAPDGAARGSSTLNSGNSAPRGVASTIAGDKTWVIDANRKVYVYNAASGALLGSWTAGSLANNANPEGIATNGTDIWIVDAKSDKVFRYTGAATRLSGSQNAASSFSLNNGNSSPKDIATDGQSHWVVNDANTDKVFKYTLAGSLLGSWTIDSANRAPTGITIDPANVSHIWIVDSGTDRVYQYNAAATRTSGSQPAAAWFALAAGNTNPQGIADPPAPTTVADVVRLRPVAYTETEIRDAMQTSAIPKKNRRPETLPATALAHDEAFESLALERTDVERKRSSRTVAAGSPDDATLADPGPVIATILSSALDVAFASVKLQTDHHVDRLAGDQ